jgi:Domain of unknown function (DUF5134)
LTIPAWILDIFAAIMLVVAAVSAARLVVARPWQRGRGAATADIDISHLLMAIAMAGTLAAGLRTLPNDAWDVIFAVLTAWFGYHVARDARRAGIRALSGGHCAPHLVHTAAMLYMFVAVTAPAASGGPGMGGMGGSGTQTLSLPILAFLFALILIGYSIWDLDQLSGPGASGHYSLAAARIRPAGTVLSATPALAGAESPAAAFSGPTSAASPTSAGSPSAGSPSAGSPSAGSTVATVTPPAEADLAASCDPDPVTGGVGHLVLAPWVATSCRIAMGITMALMLIIMI